MKIVGVLKNGVLGLSFVFYKNSVTGTTSKMLQGCSLSIILQNKIFERKLI